MFRQLQNDVSVNGFFPRIFLLWFLIIATIADLDAVSVEDLVEGMVSGKLLMFGLKNICQYFGYISVEKGVKRLLQTVVLTGLYFSFCW